MYAMVSAGFSPPGWERGEGPHFSISNKRKGGDALWCQGGWAKLRRGVHDRLATPRAQDTPSSLNACTPLPPPLPCVCVGRTSPDILHGSRRWWGKKTV